MREGDNTTSSLLGTVPTCHTGLNAVSVESLASLNIFTGCSNESLGMETEEKKRIHIPLLPRSCNLAEGRHPEASLKDIPCKPPSFGAGLSEMAAFQESGEGCGMQLHIATDCSSFPRG